MQLKNVGVIVVILVPRHNTVTVQREDTREDSLSSVIFPLWHTRINTCTYTHTLIFVIHF